MAYVVSASLAINDAAGIGCVADPEGNVLDHPSIQRLGLKPDGLARIVVAIKDGVRSLGA